jgi:hypothetical protein
MKYFFIIIALVTVTNMAKAQTTFNTNKSFASLYEGNSVEYKELLGMTVNENKQMNDCTAEAMNEADKNGELDLDLFEATDYCLNDVLGDIHN